MDREAAAETKHPAFGQSGLRISAANNQRPRMLILADDPVMLCMVGANDFQQHDIRAVTANVHRPVRLYAPDGPEWVTGGKTRAGVIRGMGRHRGRRPRPTPGRLSRSLVALDQNSTIIAVVELSQSSWLVGGVVPGIERQPRKKLEPSPERLLAVLHRWRDEAVRAGRTITRIALAFEAGRDGFWLARWLDVRGVEAHVIHPSSVAVSREHRRVKTDRLDTELLEARVLGVAAWRTGQLQHAVPLKGQHRQWFRVSADRSAEVIRYSRLG